MRCLTLAGAFKSCDDIHYQCTFAVSHETIDIVPMLADSGDEVVNSMDLITTEEKYDVAVVDHYDLDQIYEVTLRQIASEIVVIDDLANRPHDCDLLIDQTYGRGERDYVALVPSSTRLLLGADYALLRDQFSEQRATSLARRGEKNGTINRVLVFMGGSDPDNVTLKVLEALNDDLLPKNLMVDLVLGAQAAERMKISDRTSRNPNIKWYSDVRNMAELMAVADLAIGAGGTASWERCCLGVPSLVIEIADNQKLIASRLEQAGAIRNLGWHEDITPKDLVREIVYLVENKEINTKMSCQAAGICDGRGAQRVVKEIGNLFERKL